jgi:hypothetical protein
MLVIAYGMKKGVIFLWPFSTSAFTPSWNTAQQQELPGKGTLPTFAHSSASCVEQPVHDWLPLAELCVEHAGLACVSLTRQAAHAAAHQHTNTGLVQRPVAFRVGMLLQASSLEGLQEGRVAPHSSSGILYHRQDGGRQRAVCTFFEATMV